MTAITTNRGTSTINVQGLVFGKKNSVTLTIKRGTDVAKVKGITIEQPSLKGLPITVNRGTEVIIL